MTTLEAIGFTFAGGSVVFTISLALFGLAVRLRSTNIAPRCTARPRNVIFNPKAKPPSATNVSENANKNSLSSQYRGNALIGWIFWSLGLTYAEMIEGVAGTGTRNDGLDGSLLKVNIDSCVLLRFHSLCLKISAVTTFLCLVVILPLNLTAKCFGDDKSQYTYCSNSNYNLTNYEQTTLANIPTMPEVLNEESLLPRDVLLRLYLIVFCLWFITYYVCISIKREWIDILAIRRVYYLEEDIWQTRKEELEATLLSQIDDIDDVDDVLIDREPWIPHPEQRDTVPNIELYSLLVGNLPQVPHQVLPDDDVEMSIKLSKRKRIDWQLELTKTFFDQAIPNQPGFTSSVAAVTILPSSKELGQAWSSWYKYASALRRLIFIRKLITKIRYYEIDLNNYDEEDEESYNDEGSRIGKDFRFEGQGEIHSTIGNRDEELQQRRQHARISHRSPRNAYKESIQNLEYYKEVFSTFYCSETDEVLLANCSEQQGPEQTAVYSRELAQSAAACCPNGCCEGRLRNSGIDDLVLEERDAIIKVQDAFNELRAARSRAAAGADLSSLIEGESNNNRDEEEREKDDKQVEINLSCLEPPPLNSKEQKKPPPLQLPKNDNVPLNDISNSTSDDPLAFEPTLDLTGSGLRSRIQSSSTSTEKTALSERWDRVGSIVNQDEWNGIHKMKERRELHSGGWHMVSFPEMWLYIKESASRFKQWLFDRKVKVIDEYTRESTYAVVTFTSRHAAIEARKCLLDGRGQDRWFTETKMPVPPLADASAWRICPCRGCSRPVTLTLPDKQKLSRKIVVLASLAAIYIFYTIPLTLASNAANPTNYEEIWTIFPGLEAFKKENEHFFLMISGLVPALIWTLFFATCPVIFKSIANFGSNSSSVIEAEHRSIQYFWWFMFLTAFTGNLLVTMVINGFNEGLRIGSEFQTVLESVAAAIPTSVSSQWLNWIIVRTTMTLPLQYMLQINTFLFGCLRWDCCKRCVMGGGAGPSIPYRIYVDSGVVFMCLVALAPASPLVAPVAFLYFLYCHPLFRRNCIFVYRPKFDGGGIRWPFLSDILISSIMVSHILMCTMMFLKRATGPALVALFPIGPTILFRLWMRRRFLRAFEDGALLQTSILDNWDATKQQSMEKREEFRRFLVDAHKAAYVPICIAGCEQGKKGSTLTAEPAVTIPHANDGVSGVLTASEDDLDHLASTFPSPPKSAKNKDPNGLQTLDECGVVAPQYGASFTRVRCFSDDSSAGHISFNDDGSIRTSIRQTDHLQKMRRLSEARINIARATLNGESDLLF